MKIELRNSEVTLAAHGQGLMVKGYVNKPGELSELIGTTKKFKEKIAVGAFKSAISNRTKDIDFLAEHDTKQVLSSTSNDSLVLREDAEGVYMEARISETSYGKDYYTLITDGLIKSMSFGMRVLKDSWKYVEGVAVRTVHEFELVEVSAVKNPAYSQSSISARNIDIVEEVDVPEMEQKNTERGFEDMEMKLEKRTNEADVFEQYLRGQVEARALTTTNEGTAVIPENVSSFIVKRMEEVSPAFQQARKIESVAGSLKIPKENDAITGGFFGEGENIIEEQLSFEEVKLNQKRLGAALAITNQMVNDSGVDITAYSQELLARRLAKTAEQAIFVGDGVKQFNGLLNEPGLASVETTAVVMDNLIELYTSIHPDFIAESAFYMNRDLFNQVAKMRDGNGHLFLQNGVVNGRVVYQLLGVPVHVTEALPAANPAVFANMKEAYTIMVKKGMALNNIVDTTQALRGSRLLVADSYMDGATVNSQAVAKLTVTA
ncbi:phage major capsid protein [Bacillus sp. NTK071]|uniref:phage major capsid protein n=1 Tax=Bacillus sp. NTK071 TaxID=2802175 RepID=UPI001A8DA421|nr:phage major capsid protein [Bacillus sp. NTK071]MBN8211095.1 phage major capsid protein [Bacillus sp. NTK071]